LATTQWQRSFATDTKVSFAALSQDEIAYYVDTFQPYDKAGAYGIQEWIGYVAVENIEGSYFNVMGLPIQRIYQELKQL
jgi:septum formation protein